ncbi:hypothetical protein [Labedaea rhizosphaerae]|uniref:PPE family protein n=1 Tax=Labedaea rhizosphaerae TaxID=598644 RepID=A0A4V3D0B3_LABRH|nr:hypothetical protein [Labedaea rhizosphaerae]TDQ05125.1 hypothetical protein EV186_1011090 [Labedaea rhizosphaerae]
MTVEPDVRLAGVTHEEILAWVTQGKAGASAHVIDTHMKRIVDALREAADGVRWSLAKIDAGGWEGSTADSVTSVMAALRDFDSELHQHGNDDRDSTMGQSGESAATRHRVPPIPLDLDGQHSILGTTVDPKVRIDARRNAEDRAREVMAEYQEATRERLAALPRIAPVPSLVLDTTTDGPSTQTTTHGQAGPTATRPLPASSGKPTTAPSQAPVKPVAHAPDSPGHHREEVPVSAAQRATGRMSVSRGQTPAGTSAARGDPATAGSGPVPTAVIGGIAAVPVGGGPVVGGSPGGDPDVLGTGGPQPGEGSKSGVERQVERVVERQPAGQRPTTQPRTSGNGGLVGGAAGAPGKEQEEHHNRYRVPSGEPFDTDTDDEYLRDGEFYVVPDVIGGSE